MASTCDWYSLLFSVTAILQWHGTIAPCYHSQQDGLGGYSRDLSWTGLTRTASTVPAIRDTETEGQPVTWAQGRHWAGAELSYRLFEF